MLRRTFLKAVGAAVAVACLPISLISKVAAKVATKGPAAICPVCATENITLKNGEMKCYEPECGAEGHVMVRISCTKWPGIPT